jgi:hypothetical protein
MDVDDSGGRVAISARALARAAACRTLLVVSDG